MLKARVITGLVLAFALCVVIYLLPAQIYFLAMAFVCLCAAWEWTNLAGMQTLVSRVSYTLLMGLLMAAVFFLPAMRLPLFGVSLIWWVVAFALILSYPGKTTQWSGIATMLVIGLLVILPSWASLLQLREHAHFRFLFTLMIVLITFSDIGAYFSGRAFGRYKLAKDVSPNKTWEGFAGGLFLSTLAMTVVGYVLLQQGLLNTTSYLVTIAGAALISAMSVVGDLYESMCKRHRGIKDSGTILPGHGGMLDRIDSFTAATPLFMLLVMLVGKL